MEEKSNNNKKPKSASTKAKSNNKKPLKVLESTDRTKQLSDLAESFNSGLQTFRTSISVLDEDLELLNIKDDVTIEDDERINELLDSSYRFLDNITSLTNEIYYFVVKDHNEEALTLYGDYLDAKNDLSKIKEKATDMLSKKWRENVYRQQKTTSDLLEEIKSQNNETSELKKDIVVLKNENDELYKNLSASQKSIADSSNRFITIVALLVSLLAIIFGNIIQFTKTDLSWQSVVIVNASILLSSCVIFTIIENIHLISLKGFQKKDAESHIQRSFNVVMFSIILIVSAVLVCSILSLNVVANSNASPSEESSSIIESVSVLFTGGFGLFF